jgi:hypothetical protein
MDATAACLVIRPAHPFVVREEADVARAALPHGTHHSPVPADHNTTMIRQPVERHAAAGRHAALQYMSNVGT